MTNPINKNKLNHQKVFWLNTDDKLESIKKFIKNQNFNGTKFTLKKNILNKIEEIQEEGTKKNLRIVGKSGENIKEYITYVEDKEVKPNYKVIGITFDDDGYLEFVVEVDGNG